MTSSCDCVIPIHNEDGRIPGVLDAVLKVREVAHIICVDDGSDRELVAVPDSPRIRLVRLAQNRGKAEAVAAGLRLVKHPYVLLLDADLQGLRAAEISRAIVSMTSNPHIDMIILRRVHSITSTKLLRGDALFSGERILRVEDLEKVLATHPSGYQLEIAINRYMLEHGRCVYWMPSSATNTLKVQKLGRIRGLVEEANMIVNLLTYSGLAQYLLQLLVFARKQGPRSSRPGAHTVSPNA